MFQRPTRLVIIWRTKDKVKGQSKVKDKVNLKYWNYIIEDAYINYLSVWVPARKIIENVKTCGMFLIYGRRQPSPLQSFSWKYWNPFLRYNFMENIEC